MNDVVVRMEPDSGADVNVMDEHQNYTGRTQQDITDSFTAGRGFWNKGKCLFGVRELDSMDIYSQMKD